MKKFSRLQCVCAVLVSVPPQLAGADDWPQWLGPQRESVWRETGILEQFPAAGPTVLWRHPVGGGFAGPAVAGGRVFVMDYVTDTQPTPSAGRRDKLEGTERLLCLSAAEGKLLWKQEYARPYNISYPAGPRATPTVDEDRVYTLGAEGNLNCRQVADGSVVWSRDLPKEYGFTTPQWGCAGHPLVDGEKLICLVGGEGSIAVAFNKRTGQELWRALSAQEAGYSSPVIIQAGGTRQLIIWHVESINSLDPETGQLYWSQPLKPDWSMSIATPRSDGKFLFTGAIVLKSAMLQLAADRPAAEVAWYGQKGVGIAPTTSTPFMENGYMYGVDREGELRCIELATGKQAWTTYAATTQGSRTDNATAFLVKQADRFFIFNEFGQLVIARLTPAGYQELSRATILEPAGTSQGRAIVWSHPAYAQQCIFARNDREIVCVSLAAKP
ncbi:MAG: PQQ-binding-like beta-propeller repeat protein [Pirellulaceae bacterium]